MTAAEPGPAAYPWRPGSATGVGSLPGTDPREALRLVLGELPDLPHLPELPARGPGADLLGRGAALLVDLHVDLQPAGWRLVDRPGMDERRARAHLARDLDALEELAAGYVGSLKVQVAGPWTLAAGLELTRGGKALGDPGACRDLFASLAEGVAGHVADVRRRVPGASVVLQLDEPSLPAVLAGRLPTASGYDVLPAPEPSLAESGLRAVVEAAGAPVVVHCCAAEVPVPLLVRAGAAGVSLDLSLLPVGGSAGERSEEALGAAVEAGVGLLLGVVPAVGTPGDLSEDAATVEPVRALWRRIGLDPARLPAAVVPTPACGLAGATPAYARAALARCRDVAARLVDDPEG